MPYDECSNPVCGTLGLMVGLGKVTLERVDESNTAVRCKWERDGNALVGFGHDWRDAVKDCCEKNGEADH